MKYDREAPNPLVAAIARITDKDFLTADEIVRSVTQLTGIALTARDPEEFLRCAELAGLLDYDLGDYLARWGSEPFLDCSHRDRDRFAKGVRPTYVAEILVCALAKKYDVAPALIAQSVGLIGSGSRTIYEHCYQWPNPGN